MTSLGDTARIVATVLDQFGAAFDSPPPLLWVGTAEVGVSSSGLVTANFTGSGTILVTGGGVSALATVTITQEPARVVLSPTSVRYTALSESGLVSWQVQDARGNRIILASISQWSSSNTAVASVDGDGSVRAVGNGSAVVTAQAGSARGTVDITVAQQPASIETTPFAVASMTVGSTLRCLASVRDSRNNLIPGAVVTWTSLTPSLVAISPTGVASALAPGSGMVVASINGITRNISLLISR
jgi:hypothetical protein